MRPMSRTSILLAAAAVLCGASAASAGILGGPPRGFDPKKLTKGPNDAAMVRKIWFPGIEGGYVPQGVALAGKLVLVSAYHGEEKKPARVFAVDAATGKSAGSFSLPANVKHAGGLAHDGARTLYVVDKGLVLPVDLQRALQQGSASGAALGAAITVDKKMGPSFAAWDARRKRLWIGLWIDDGLEAKAFAYRVNPVWKRALGTKDAEVAIPIVNGTQGIAVASDGSLWLSQSSSQYGRLQKVNAANGKIAAQYAMPAGIEDLEVDAGGLVWSVSESGSKKYQGKHWRSQFPVIFALDARKLAAMMGPPPPPHAAAATRSAAKKAAPTKAATH